MLKSYLKLAWRNLIKNKVSSVINIGGLIVGLSTSILIMLMIVDEFSYDSFHENLSNIYLLEKNQQNTDGVNTGSSTAGPMAAALRGEMPETKYAARVAGFGGELTRAGDKTVYESGIYADPDLFKMMSFAVLLGDPVVTLEDASSVVITASTAKQLFGNENALGKTIVFKNKTAFRIGAVVKDIPSNSSIRFNMVIPFQFFEKDNNWLTKWDDNRINTWIQLQPGANIIALNKKLTHLLQAKTGDKTESLFVYPMKATRLYNNFSNGKPSGGRIYVVLMLAVLGLFILLIACINFMNLATARSEHRAREVGVRKVLGASRKLIIFQFFSETLLMTFIALLFSMLLAVLVLPWFNQLTQKQLHFDFYNGWLWVLLIVVGLVTGLIAGSYPAVFLSRFNTVKVLKGVLSTNKKGGGLRTVLVTFQFVISIFLIIATIVLFAELKYVRDRPIGYDQENLIEIAATGELESNYSIFKNELVSIPEVKNISAGTDNILQFGGAVTGMDWPGKVPGQELSVIVSHVAYDWTRTAGLKMIEGRDFSPAFGTDTAACLINETAVQKMRLKAPVVGTIVGGSRVIGVFKNFVFNNPSGVIAPMAVYLQTNHLNHVFIRIANNNQWRQTLARIEKIAKKINPGYPFDYSFTQEGYQQRFKEFANIGKLAALFGGMAIFISCLGLFGLSAFVAEKRSKEMSIRKVLGAGIQQIWVALSKDFFKPVIIAFLIVVPLGVWAMHTLLANIAYHVSLSWWMFALAGCIVLTIALLTVSYQGIKTGFEKPVANLRND
ncbi:MAG TPA: ABC transporter permease [Chitinophagaceae bacterium]|nr:ABC transporter permease [Chitinophagaceae bacterium]